MASSPFGVVPTPAIYLMSPQIKEVKYKLNHEAKDPRP